MAVYKYAGGSVADSNWMVLEQTATPTSSGAGVVEIEYTGAASVGGTVYVAVIQPNTTPTESFIWTETIQ